MKRGLLLGGALVGLITIGVTATTLLLSDRGSNPVSSRPMVLEGEMAPAFTLEGADGGTISLGDYSGAKNVLLYFSMAYG